MRIGLDVFGGDYAPDVCVNGAVLALNDLCEDDVIYLFGDENQIKDRLKLLSDEDYSRIKIIDCKDVILMDESPIKAFTSKPDSSVSVGFKYLAEGRIDAFASAGNTGAMLVGTKYSIGLIDGVLRPSLGSVLPKESGGFNFFLDVGTNPDAKPEVLEQFAMLGYTFFKNIYGFDNPRVALLNIGEEECKGSINAQATFELLKNNKIVNFVGNMEGRDMFSDKAEVFVCDGFVGNILLKFTESFYDAFKKRGINDAFVDRLNYECYGGTPLLGANGIVMIGHGISNEVAIKNMILRSKKCFKGDLVTKLKMVINS